MNTLQTEPKQVGQDQYQIEKERNGGVGIELCLSLSPEEDIPKKLLWQKLREGKEVINGTPVLWGKPRILEADSGSSEAVVFFPILQISRTRNCFSIRRVAFDGLEQSIKKELNRYEQTLYRVGQRMKSSGIDFIKGVNLILEFKFRVNKKIL